MTDDSDDRHGLPARSMGGPPNFNREGQLRRVTPMLLALALPGSMWAIVVESVAGAPLFGELPTRADEAISAGALCSAASVWLVVAVAGVPLRRGVLVVVGLIAASGFAAVAAGLPGTPFASAATDSWRAAWAVPTSWVLAVAAVAFWFPAARRKMITWRMFQ